METSIPRDDEKQVEPAEQMLDNFEKWTPTEKRNFLWRAKHPLYEEAPVDIKTFVNSPEYMDAKNECWETIKDDLEDLFTGYDDPWMEWKYNEAVFDEGIGAGKSYKSSVIITYMVYRTLIVKDPHKFLHLARGSGIYFMNMSIRGDQARKVVFGEIAQRINNSPWFRSHNYLPNPQVKSELQMPKHINIIPGNSKETFPLGFNLLGAVMDEAAWYTETQEHDVAEEMFNALYNRIKNRFGRKGILVMISSPRYVDDFIEKKMEEAKKNNRIFTRRRTSWESKPKEMFSGVTFELEGFTIPIEYQTEANRNFERFKRDIMAIPSLALEPYFKRWELVEASVTKERISPISEGVMFHSWYRGNPNYSYYLHIDLSLTTDATGIAMCHREGSRIIVDLVMQIKAKPKMEIDLAEIRAIVYDLRSRGFNIKKCTFDQFQSASSIQELNKMGITSEKLSIDKDLGPYETLKEGIYTGNVELYFYEPLMMELRRLELVEGKKVDHPANSSKDISDALAGAVFNCVKDENTFMFWFAGDLTKHMTHKEMLKESETMAADGRVPYGYYRGRR